MSVESRILGVLSASDRPLVIRQIVERIPDYSPSHVRRMTLYLHRHGFIARRPCMSAIRRYEYYLEV